MAQDLYRFFDRQGNTRALRADLTVPVARIVGTRLFEHPLPLRLFYVERVFRHIVPQAGQRREFTQAGVELIGADTPQADAEVVALAAGALSAVGIHDFCLTVGQLGFFRALTNALYLTQSEIARLERVIDRRNDGHLCAVLDEMELPESIYTLLRALPTLSGGREVIDRARQLLPVDDAHAELDRLQAVYDALVAYGLRERIVIDLGEVRGMEYYTGLVFQGYAAGVGTALCSGGRYNDLIGHFGPDLPAVGFGFDVDLARPAAQPEPDSPPEIIVQGCMHTQCLAAVQRMRESGVRVTVDALERDGKSLSAYARSRRIRAACCLEPGRWKLIDCDGRTRVVDVEHIVEKVTTWSHKH
jgi:ATP phosphoribosyltransferase regulatory subunit